MISSYATVLIYCFFIQTVPSVPIGLPGFPESTCARENPGVGLSGHGDIFGFATTTSNEVIESTGV